VEKLKGRRRHARGSPVTRRVRRERGLRGQGIDFYVFKGTSSKNLTIREG
jgi:hypothetical protein